MKDYLEEYKKKLITAEEAARMVKSNDVVTYGSFNLKPIDFDKALGARAGEPGLENVYVRLSGGVPPAPTVITNDLQQKTFVAASWYFTAQDRYFGDRGLMRFLPLNYHETNGMATRADHSLHTKGNVWCGQVTSMDKHGYFNIGVTNVANRDIALGAPVTILEVNNTMPRCLGGFSESIHVSEIDYIIEGSNTPIFTAGVIPDPTPAERRIAELIVEEIYDGCCLQLGIGSMPNTIGKLIVESDLKDLGIQTEMFCPAMVDLHESGKVTNAKKRVDRFKTTYSFALGDKDTYEFMNDNPALASCPVDYVNSPDRIMLQDDIMSINNLLEIDLLSQVCSETSGLRQVSGSGGQLDWVQGAFDSNGGKSFLAFESTYTDKQGQLYSRIKPMLTPGSVVTVPRHSVHWVVTEYGKVMMKGLSVWQRVEELVKIAHPDFRDELLAEATKMGIWKRTNRRPL